MDLTAPGGAMPQLCGEVDCGRRRVDCHVVSTAAFVSGWGRFAWGFGGRGEEREGDRLLRADSERSGPQGCPARNHDVT